MRNTLYEAQKTSVQKQSYILLHVALATKSNTDCTEISRLSSSLDSVLQQTMKKIRKPENGVCHGYSHRDYDKLFKHKSVITVIQCGTIHRVCFRHPAHQ